MPSETMKQEITTDKHKSVAPYTNIYGHGPVIFIQEYEDREIVESIFTCFDCGYTSTDQKGFVYENCERENNRVNQTMRELIEENEYPE